MNYLPDDDIALTVSKLLETCGIPHTIDFIRNTLMMHPDYPSLLSLSESLLEWGVETNAVQGTINDLSEADYPSIAYLKNNRYVVLESIKDNKVTVIFPTKGRISLTLDEFDKAWSGIILRVSPTENAQEKDFKLHRRNHLLKRVQQFLTFPGLFLFGLAAFIYLALNSTGLTILIPLGITKLIGLSACVALFAGHNGRSRIFESICPSSRISNCHRVMDSPAGRILGIPMADLGEIKGDYASGKKNLPIIFLGSEPDDATDLNLSDGSTIGCGRRPLGGSFRESRPPPPPTKAFV